MTLLYVGVYENTFPCRYFFYPIFTCESSFMKRVSRFSICACMALLVSVTACKKKAGTSANTGSDAAALSHLFGELRRMPYAFSVVAGRDVIVYCERGTKFHFYTNSFKDAGGHAISSGTIELVVTEVYKTSDFITWYAPTTTADGVLVSGGEIHIAATMNGQPVYANKYSIGFVQAEASNQPMQLFYGLVGGDSVVTWSQNYVPNSGTAVASTSSDGSGSNFYRYQFDSCAHFDWVGCAHSVVSTSSKTGLEVVLPDASFNASNARVFISIPGSGIVVNASVSSDNIFNLPSSAALPVGSAYEAIVLAVKNGVSYYSESSGTITGGLVLHPAVSAKSKDDIKNALLMLE